MKTLKNAKFGEVFAALKKILARHKADFTAKFDTPDNYYLETKAALWRGHPIFFGAAQIKKNYVTLHLMPIYMCPDLLIGISPELKKRMQGKACFNFKETDKTLFAELEKLTAACLGRWASKDFLRRRAEKIGRGKS